MGWATRGEEILVVKVMVEENRHQWRRTGTAKAMPWPV